MRKIIVFILFMPIILHLFGSSLIKGKIVDFNDKSPLQYVDVALFMQGSKSLINTRMINLSISYNFGNTKPKKTDLKKIQNNQDTDM